MTQTKEGLRSSGDEGKRKDEGNMMEMIKQMMERAEENRKKENLEAEKRPEERSERDKLETKKVLEDIITTLEGNQRRIDEKLEEIQRRTDEKIIESHKILNDNLNVLNDIQRNSKISIENLEIRQQITETNVESNKINLEYLKEKLVDEEREIAKWGQITNHNSESIGRIESHVVELEGNFVTESRTLKGTVEEWNKENNEALIRLRKEIDTIRISGTGAINSENYHQLYKIKPEVWPKFKGNGDKIHPMTYLNNLLKLTVDIHDPRLILTLIRLTLEERALEWYEMVLDKCSTIEDFQREFKHQFWNKKHQDYQRVRLMTGKYNEKRGTRENYACDLYNRSKHIENTNEAEIAQHILNHFILSDNQSIICQSVGNMDELIEILRRLDYLTEVQNREKFNKGN
ncbi:putative leucine-rich repeat-containing protein DDB_G0290503 [Onthophagus taurus]|uniref:putative leucine-rich repeat-containing protein DDB_G0290503 n=1 Tax=Onthophagus taurus TaxID=166361 RepID=UPI0039BE2DE7